MPSGPAPANAADLQQWADTLEPYAGPYTLTGDYPYDPTLTVNRPGICLRAGAAVFYDDTPDLERNSPHLTFGPATVGCTIVLPGIIGSNPTGKYDPSREAQHGVVISGCQNSHFKAGEAPICDTWGDGVYVVNSDRTTPTRGCTLGTPLRPLILARNGRQGFGVTGAEGCTFRVDVDSPGRTYVDVEPNPKVHTGVHWCRFHVTVRGDSALPGAGLAFSASAQGAADNNVIARLTGVDREARIALLHAGHWQLLAAEAARTNTPAISLNDSHLVVGDDVRLPVGGPDGGPVKGVPYAIKLLRGATATVLPGASFYPTPALAA